jgi:hypothetical protein
MRPSSRRELQHTPDFNYRLRRGRRVAERFLGLLTKRFAILAKAIDVFAQTAQLLVTNACVLHNFIMKQNSNGDEAVLPEGATDTRAEDISNVTIRPIAGPNYNSFGDSFIIAIYIFKQDMFYH